MKKYLVTAWSVIAFSSFFSQEIGVLPFTGATYLKNGISFKEIVIELDEHAWTSNRIPMGTTFEIKLEKPGGFYVENELCYPGVEVLILKSTGDTLGYSPNIFGENAEGMDYSMLSNLSLSLSFREPSKTGDSCTVLATFFDTKSNAQTQVILPLVIVSPDEKPDISFSTYGASSTYENYSAKSSGLELGSVKSGLDSSSLSSKALYRISLTDLTGLSPEEFATGTIQSQVVDASLETVDITALCTARAEKSTSDESKTTVTVKFPYDISVPHKSALPDKNIKFVPDHYFYRFRWESPDHSKVMVVVQEINK